MNPLGRRVPSDFSHVEKYRLTPATTPTKPVPVTIGVDWLSGFDVPTRFAGRWWIGRGSLTTWGDVRGGHALCIRPESLTDSTSWWSYYDQGDAGSCVGYASSRMMSLLNRKRYNARWLWHQARLIDEWTDNDDMSDEDQGTSVRAACDILRKKGHLVTYNGKNQGPPSQSEGIQSVNRWATTVDQVRAALQSPSYDAVEGFPLLNSWGSSWPHQVWLPFDALQELLDRDGEACVVVDA